MEYRTGLGYDVHALRPGLPMWLCFTLPLLVSMALGFLNGLFVLIRRVREA